MSAFFSINYVILESGQCQARLEALYADLPHGMIQLNIFDTVCDDATQAATQKVVETLGADASYHDCAGQTMAHIYNKGLECSSGAYVNFCNSTIYLTSQHIMSLHGIINKNNSFKIFCFTPYKLSDRHKILPYFESKKNVYKKDENFINLCLQSYFWKKELVKEKSFNEDFSFESDVDFIIRNIEETKKYYISNVNVESDFIFETDYYNFPDQYYIEWYGKTLQDVYLPLLTDYNKSIFVQLAVAYLVELRFACNRNNRNKNIVSEDMLNDFLETCAAVFSKIEDSILLKYNINNKKLFPKYMSFVMLKIKYRNPYLKAKIFNTAKYLFAAFKNNIIDSSENMNMEVKAINRFGKNIIIDYEINNTYFIEKKALNGFAKVGSKKIPFVVNKVYSLDKYFGKTMKSGFTGTVTILEELFKKGASIEFYLSYKNCFAKLPVRFLKTAARLSNNKFSYWKFGRYVMVYDEKKSCLRIRTASSLHLLTKELGLYSSLIKKGIRHEEPIGRMLKVMGIRLAYWLTKPFMKKEIWLSFDQLFKGGDNGEYLFRYVNDSQVDGVAMYYIINKNCEDSIRLKKTYKNIVAYNSFKSRLLSLHASYVFATRVDVKQYCGFTNAIEGYFRDLLKYRVLCLQHGLSIQQIAEYQNKIFDNTLYYFCVSEYEIKNIIHPVYGYTKERLLLTGAPRYDGLISKDKRQILIAPTWRRNVTAGTNRKGEMHAYSVNFKDTEYYRIYNSLINDEKLIASAKRLGYRLIYLVHPILSPQVGDFERNEYVEILAGASGNINYEKMLSESSLMVTDHSGIQYDFAFMKKPLVYYHPDTLPPQYDAKTMDYETMGFGPVCRNHETVVDAICSYMEKQCVIDSEYERRIDVFFAFTDRNNCKRIVESMAYIRALETKRDTIAARYMAWSMSGYEICTGKKDTDTALSARSCRLGTMAKPLRVRKFSPEGVHLEWTSAMGAKGYTLFRKSSGNEDYIEIGRISARETRYTDRSEHDWPAYYMLVVNIGHEATATATLEVEAPVCVQKPQNVRIEQGEDGTARLVWQEEAEACGYHIRFTSQSDPKKKIVTVPHKNNFYTLPRMNEDYLCAVEAFSLAKSGYYYSEYGDNILLKRESNS